MHINKNSILFQIILIFFDIVLINAGYIIAFFVKFGRAIPEFNLASYLAIWPWLTLSACALFYFYGLYGGQRRRWGELFASLVCVVFFQALAAMALTFLFRGFSFPRIVLLTAPFIQLVLLSVWRRAAWLWERRLTGKTRAVVLGRQPEALALAEKLAAVSEGRTEVSALVPQSAVQSGQDGYVLYRSFSEGSGQGELPGYVPDFLQYLELARPDHVFVCSNLSQEHKTWLINLCVAKDIKVFLAPDLYEIMLAQARLEQVDDVPVFAVGCLKIPEESMAVKRLVDIVLSLAALALAAPLCILVSIAIKVDSPGPVLYRQKRLTMQEKSFYLYKFRTMVADAERESGPVLACENDARITRVGRFLRATRLDEIPQLLNVLKGDMSIVGPRPERPFFVNQLVKQTPEYVYRMNVKSGITGLAQIAGRYSTSPENKLKYDLLYTKSYSLAKDMAILLQTVKVMLMKDRAS